ncbi:site-specific DNA-methyltransferase [Marinobacter hydrocarbonoclasticus]|nr:site-specific DNA-methyltransferase [Marinobacter nauticus]
MSTFQLSHNQAVDWLKSLGRHSADLVVTELPTPRRGPAIATELKNARSVRNQWFAIFPNDPYPGLFEQLFRVLKPNSHFYLFCRQESLFVVKPLAEAAGFRFQTVLVWDQQRKKAGRTYRSQLGWICLFEKGQRPVLDPAQSDLLSYPCDGAGKPAALLALLMNQSSQPGQLVIDPFCRDRQIAATALAENRRFCGACEDAERHPALKAELAALPGVTELLTRPVSGPALHWGQGSAQMALL